MKSAQNMSSQRPDGAPEHRWPNFFIGGAPKSGTTAMATYLSDHPKVFFPSLKEPFFWAEDLPTMRAKEGITSLDNYLALFGDAAPQQSVIGEGSTLYLYSETAIAEIQRQVPDARFLFMLRRPSQIAHAYHMQMLFHELENETDFETAWRLQDSRRQGIGIPNACKEPKLLQYRDIAKTGMQLQRVFDVVDRDRVLVIVFDEFVSDTRGVYLQILDFLGLENDGRTEFPKVNAAMKPRFKALSRFFRSGPMRRVTLLLKSVLSGPAYRLARQTKQFLNRKDAVRDEPSPAFMTELSEEFSADIALLEQLIECDLSAWKQP